MTKHKKTSHKSESRGEPFPWRWPQGFKEQTRQYDKDKHEKQMTKRIHKRSTTLERSVRKLMEGFNMFDGT